ncbi:MAG: polyprenyl synthetase family protein [Clostridiaceae bacterium]|nr:polyprenyl synthetase family protein [Clostridiaceae bacterium]
MKHKERLAEYAGMVEAGLDRLLPLDGLRQDQVMEAMRYSALGGGKRLRGAFMLEFCRISGGDVQAALPYACAIEMIHAYSLIHDDLPCMDNDDMRRGKPSCHRAFDEATALLAGDGLLNRAFETAVSEEAAGRLDAARVLRLTRELAGAAGFYGMIGGQCIDLAYDGRMPDLATLNELIALKTGALIRVACRMGCIAAGASEAQIAAADTFAARLGLAFQIRDDMLDVEGDASVLGKATHADERQGKTTYPALLGMEACRQEVDRLTGEAVEALDQFADREFLTELAWSLTSRLK